MSSDKSEVVRTIVARYALVMWVCFIPELQHCSINKKIMQLLYWYRFLSSVHDMNHVLIFLVYVLNSHFNVEEYRQLNDVGWLGIISQFIT